MKSRVSRALGPAAMVTAVAFALVLPGILTNVASLISGGLAGVVSK